MRMRSGSCSALAGEQPEPGAAAQPAGAASAVLCRKEPRIAASYYLPQGAWTASQRSGETSYQLKELSLSLLLMYLAGSGGKSFQILLPLCLGHLVRMWGSKASWFVDIIGVNIKVIQVSRLRMLTWSVCSGRRGVVGSIHPVACDEMSS